MEYRITWQQCPTAYHPLRVLFIESDSKENANAIATDYIERKHGIGWFVIQSCEVYARPSSGHVME